MKIGNDIRLLSSGPRSGLGEITIPENEPGSSIMPGKVNPTQAEALTMAACQVMGNDVAINFGGAQGHLELNVFKPVIANAFLQSVRLLGDAMASFEEHCARGIEPNRERIAELLASSLMLVTALAPTSATTRRRRSPRRPTRRARACAKRRWPRGTLPPTQYDQWVRPEQMVGPG